MATTDNSNFTDAGGAVVRLGTEAIQSALYTAQSIVDGLAQNVNHLGAGNLVGHINLISKPKEATFGTSDWYAETLGSAATLGLAFCAFRGGVATTAEAAGTLSGRMAGLAPFRSQASTFAERAAAALESTPTMSSSLRGAASGFAFGALTSPTDASSDGSFWLQRAQSGLSDGLTFGLLSGISTAGTQYGNYLGLQGYSKIGSLLRNPVVTSTVGGGIAGGATAEVDSLVTTGKPAENSDLFKKTFAYSMTGFAMGMVSKLGTSPLLDRPVASKSTQANGSPAESLQEGKAIRKDINRHAQPLADGLAKIAGRRDVSVLAVGERHLPFNSQLRQQITQSMPSLKRAGVSTIAEELPEGTQKYIDNYMSTGDFGLPEKLDTDAHVMSRWAQNSDNVSQIAMARQLGLNMRAIDLPLDSTGNRLETMANRVANLIKEEPDKKVLWIGGNWHTEQGSSAQGNSTFADILRTSIGSDKVATFGSATHTSDSKDNLLPVLEHLKQPLVVPTAPTNVLRNLNALDQTIDGRAPAIGQWDYLLLLPKKVPSFQEIAKERNRQNALQQPYLRR